MVVGGRREVGGIGKGCRVRVIVLIGAEVTAALGESECWSEESDVLNSSSFDEHNKKESSRDSVDSTSK